MITEEMDLARGAAEPPPAGSQRFIGLSLALLVLWLVGTERWGSYVAIVPGHLYISDLVVAVVVLVAVVAAPLRKKVIAIVLTASLPITLCNALLVWSVLRLLAGGHLSFTALRDFAPYGYAVVATLVAAAGRPSRRMHVVVWAALALHSIWLFVGYHAQGLLHHLPVMGDAYALLPRPDVDGMVCGITIGMCLLYAAGLASRPLWILPLMSLLVLTAVDAIELPSRGGLLASFIVLLPVVGRLARTLMRRVPRRARPFTAVAALIVVLGVGASVIFGSTAGSRLQDSFALNQVSDAGGTTHARVLVYEKTTRYVLSSPERTTVGVGFGPDFLHDSGAAKYLEGVYWGVRSPHDYLLGTWARLGIVGALIALAVTLFGFYYGWREFGSNLSSPLETLAAALLLATPVVAAVGVVLESPFGAIPWFWAFGMLCSRRRSSVERPVMTTRRTPRDDVVRSAPAPGGEARSHVR